MNPKVLKTLIWLKEAFKNSVHFIVFASLVPVALFLIALVIIAAIIFYLATINSKKQNARQILTGNARSYKLIALGIDHLGNIIGGPFFNWLLLKEASAFPFGKPGESISEILGWNHDLDNLSEWGLNLRHDLNNIEIDHCELARDIAVYNARHTLDKYRLIQDSMKKKERTQEFLAKYN